MATGNHFLFDAVAGGIVVAGAGLGARLLVSGTDRRREIKLDLSMSLSPVGPGRSQARPNGTCAA